MTTEIKNRSDESALRTGRLSSLSINRKLVLMIMLVSSASMILAGSAFIFYQWFTFRERMVTDLTAKAEMVAANSTGAVSFDDEADAAEILRSLKSNSHIAFACIYRSDGTLLAKYEREGYHRETPVPPPEADTHRFQGGWLMMFRQIFLNDQHIGTVYIQSDLSELHAFLKESAAAVGLMMLLFSIFAYALSSQIQKWVSTPLIHLAGAAVRVSKGRDYSVRAVKLGDDEFGQLTDAFNNMLEQVERRDLDLRRLRNMLSNIVNSMPSVLVGVDAEGRVTQWNLEAERMTGITAGEAEGRILNDVFPILSREMERVRSAIRNRETLRDEKIRSVRNGETRYSDVTVYPLIANGVEGAVIRMDDVTERVRIEEIMIQSEKMLSVGGLAAGMAHEINNPLAGILQNMQVIRNRISDNIPRNIQTAKECGTSLSNITEYMKRREIFSMIDAVMESGKRAGQIVDNMLSFSRKSGSRFRYHNLSQLLDRTVELASNDYDLKKKYDFRQVEIVREYAPAMPSVLCEGSKIQQVFLNLLKNGAQAMASVKEKVEVSRFILRVNVDGNMARVEIEDNGPGMEKNVMKRVFEPFFTTKGVGMGTGLGLSVSYFIITENHKGSMSVESSPGKGAKFIIRLPFKH
jgi:PAS domain S-box-containing protein